MKRFLKWLFGILFFLIIVLVAGVVALPYLVDPNEYKDDVTAMLKPYMKDRDIKIKGDIKLSIFPWLGVEVGKVVIGNAEGFILKPFMTIENSKARIRLLSLLSDQAEIGSLEFDGIQVNLQQDAEGKNNWSDLSRQETSLRSQRAQSGFIKVVNTNTTEQKTDQINIPNFKISALHLRDVRIELDDKKARDIITLSKLNIDAGPINNLNPIPIKGKFNFHSKKQKIAAASAFASSLVMGQQLDEFTFNKFVLNTNISGITVDKKTIKTSLKIPALIINTKKESIKAKPLTLKVDDINSVGRFTLKRFKVPVIRLGLEMKHLNLDKFIPEQSAGKATSTPQKKSAASGNEEHIPTVDEILAGTDKLEPVDESAKLFAPLAVFGGSDMQGTIKIENMQVRNLKFSNVKVTLLARQGLVSAQHSAKFYDGHYEGDLQINTKRKPARLTSRQRFKNIQMGPLVLALTGKETLTGRANYQSQLYSSGETQNALTENLSGDAQFSILNAEVKTLDLKQLILKENYEKLNFVKEKTRNKKVTAFDTMRGTLRIKQGVIYNKDFRATSRRIHLKGAGYVSLVEETVKYTINTRPKKSFGINLAGRRLDLKNKKIATHFTGPWSNIEIDNELEAVLKAEFKQSELFKEKRALESEAKAFVKEETEKLKQKFKDKLK